MDSWLQRIWYGRSLWVWLLLPLSLLFAVAVAIRRIAFRIGLLRSVRVAKPVLVVGNIAVGGTGKTPLVIWLVQALLDRGFKPAVITRGYGGASAKWPVSVKSNSDPALVGDEAVLIAQHTNAMVIAGPDRVAGAQEAIARGADVVISDDGLQHYRLARDFEIAVVDGARAFGNGFRLPAGPLRESVRRLASVQAVAVTYRGPVAHSDEFEQWRPTIIRSNLESARSLTTQELRPLAAFKRRRVHAIAGIGNPQAFFTALRAHGIEVDGRALRDHAAITAADIQFPDAAPVFMTEKDAVKCRGFVDARLWSIPVELEVEDAEQLLTKIESAIHTVVDRAH